jgi:hypothetical protein
MKCILNMIEFWSSEFNKYHCPGGSNVEIFVSLTTKKFKKEPMSPPCHDYVNAMMRAKITL